MEDLIRYLPKTCAYCDGPINQVEEKDHQTKLLGQTITLPVAIVGRCQRCGEANYAFRKDGRNIL